MIFKTIPQNGASWLKPVLYSWEFEQKESQVEVEIYDCLSSESLGKIMLYNIVSAEIDIAPYIRSKKLNMPLVKQQTIIASSQDACRVVLRVNGVETEPRLLFRAEIGALQRGVISSLVENPTVAVGEQIRMTVLSQRSISIVVSRPSESGIENFYYITEGLPCEIVVPINIAKVGENILLRVQCDNDLVEVFKYRVVERDSSAVRLTWVNTNGGIESHTFPLSVKRNLMVKSEDVECECGSYRRVIGSTVVRRVIMSGATQSEIDGMLDILLSPKIYRCDVDGDISVQLLTDTITYDDHGRMRRLEFDIKEEWKGGVL